MTVRLPDVPPPAELRWEWRCLPVGVDLRKRPIRAVNQVREDNGRRVRLNRAGSLGMEPSREEDGP